MPKNLHPSLRIMGSQVTDGLGVKTNPSFLGSVPAPLILRELGIFVEPPTTMKPAPGSHQTMGGRRTWIFTNACVYCVPAMVIKWCFRAAPCYSWAPWKLQQKTRSGDELPRRSPKENVFQKTRCVSQRGILPQR